MVLVIKRDVSREKILAGCQVLGIRKDHEAPVAAFLAHVARIGRAEVLQTRDAQDMPGRDDVRDHSRAAVRLHGLLDLGRIPSGFFQGFPVGLPLRLVIADVIIVRRLHGECSKAFADLRVRVTQNAAPGVVIPVADPPLLPGLIAGLAALVVPVLVTPAVRNLNRIRDLVDLRSPCSLRDLRGFLGGLCGLVLLFGLCQLQPLSLCEVGLVDVDVSGIAHDVAMARVLPDGVPVPRSKAIGICPGAVLVVCRLIGSVLRAPQFILLRDLRPVVFPAYRFGHVDDRTHTSKTIELIAECKAPYHIFSRSECGILCTLPVKPRHALSDLCSELLSEELSLFFGVAALSIVIHTGELPCGLNARILGLCVRVDVPGALREFNYNKVCRGHQGRFQVLLITCNVCPVEVALVVRYGLDLCCVAAIVEGIDPAIDYLDTITQCAS